MTMTAFPRGSGRLRAFFSRIARILRGFRRPVGRHGPIIDKRDIPDSLRRDIGLCDTLDRGRGSNSAAGRNSRRTTPERENDWQRHLDRPILPPV
jgi:hypothetical protein